MLQLKRRPGDHCVEASPFSQWGISDGATVIVMTVLNKLWGGGGGIVHNKVPACHLMLVFLTGDADYLQVNV